VKCPYCGGNPIVQERDGVLVCIHCGSVICERPIDDSSTARYYDDVGEEPYSGYFTYILHDLGAGSTRPISLRDFAIKLKGWERLEKCLRILYRRYYGVVFKDKCIVEESARLIHVALRSDHAKTPSAEILETLVKVAVLIASRKCGREIEVEALFPRLKRGGLLRVLSRVFERFPVLKEHYVTPRTRESIRKNIVKAVACLESSKLVEDTVTGEIVKHSVELLNKLPTAKNNPSTIAALIYLSTRTIGLKITQKNIAKCTGTSIKALQHTLTEIKKRKENQETRRKNKVDKYK